MFILLALTGLMTASPAYAQKMGTIISIDGNSCGKLWAQDANGTSGSYFGFLRHKQAPIQLISSNYSEVDELGIFTIVANNMTAEGTELTYTTFGGQSTYGYLGIVAPKGYRIMRYQFDIDQSSSASKNGLSITEYTYDGSNVEETENSATVINSSTNELKLDVTKSGSVNKLYFKINSNGSTSGNKITFKSVKITYAIDDVYSAQLPNSDGGTTVHTDMMNLGEFFYNSSGAWVFNTSSISDLQEVGIYNATTKISPDVVQVNGNKYFVAASNGDYYIEAPEKYRIVGATVNFLRSEAMGISIPSFGDVTTITSGESYIITDGKGHYLSCFTNKVVMGTNPSTASKWTFTGSGSSYTIKNGDYYLKVSNNALVVATTSPTTWICSGTSIRTSSSYVTYSGNKWVLASSSIGNIAKLQNESTTTGASFTSGDFTGSVYGREGNVIVDEGTAVLTEENNEASITVNDFNNDAIRINISGLTTGVALYNVQLQLLPLNPEVQTVQVAGKINDDNVTGNTSVTSENYHFSDVNIVVPSVVGQSSYDVVFRNAYNEEYTEWYNNGTTNNIGYSNYYLVSSNADGGTTDASLNRTNGVPSDVVYPFDRQNSDKVGTVALNFSNIDEVISNKLDLADNKFSKSDAGYQSVALSNGKSSTVYLYSADEPTFLIMPSGASSLKHIAYRYYDVKVTLNVMQETPDIAIKAIYTSTLKGKPSKQTSSLTADDISNTGTDSESAVDKQHTYIGITVSSKYANGTKAPGYLTSEAIINAIKAKIYSESDSYYGFGENDPYRGILYVDMSGLVSVSDAAVSTGSTTTYWDQFNEATADNCLYFMYPSFSRGGITNTITATGNNSYEAVSNIVIQDQQPFYTPYKFGTGTHTASYTRNITHGKDKVKQMTSILPFGIKLDGEGHPYFTSDRAEESITFMDITGKSGRIDNRSDIEDPGYAFAVLATPIEDNEAKANMPYFLQSTTDVNGFTVSVTQAQFDVTPSSEDELTQGDTWVGHGTFAGMEVNRDDNLFIFSSGYFHKTGAQKIYKKAYVLPFRVYYDAATDANVAKTDGFCVVTSMDGITTGIADVNVHDGSLSVKTQRGSISVTAGKQTAVRIYSVGGQLVGSGTVKGGQTASYPVAQGVYIVNGVKVVVE